MQKLMEYKAQMFILSFFLFACTAVPQRSALTQTSPPYPASNVITAVFYDWSTHIQQAPGSDNWSITWADDGNQYTSWGDGGGFDGTNSDGRESLGVARIEGNKNNYIGYNVWGGKNQENPSQFGGKSYGILSVGGNLYMWVSPGSSSSNYDETRLAKSTDHSATWTKADWAFEKADGIVLPTILQFGRDYAGALDNYIYSYFIRLQDGSELKVQVPGQIYLARVHKNVISDFPNLTKSDFEFFTSSDLNNPTWGAFANRKPVFEDPNGVGWNLSVSHNTGLNRYLLMTEHSKSFKGNLGIFDAPNPWGPWTTVAYYSNWLNTESTFFWNFSNKWLSTDGKSFTMVFTGVNSGANTYDSWNTLQGTFATEFLEPQSYIPIVSNQ